MLLEKLILVDPNIDICEAWQKELAKFDNVEIVNDRFENLGNFDCMVSAANSYGLMDGGVDLAIINFFGPELQTRVQSKIKDKYRGEQPIGTSLIQPIGTSLIVKTDNPVYRYIAHTPTMRVPMDISNTENVYQAMRAMLLAVDDFNKEKYLIETIACPGLGTLTGKVSPKKAAKQMALAYEFTLENPPIYLSWDFAGMRHAKLSIAR